MNKSKYYKNLNTLYTPFAEKIDKNCPLPEYPRPQLERDSYINLNGYWDYAILSQPSELPTYQGKILVPFSPESPLSGVNKLLKPSEFLYYRKIFTLPEGFKKDRVLLHFGAVDYLCKVYINQKLVGEHRGGFFPFTFDITDYLFADKENYLTMEVTDPSDTGFQQRGKQKLKRGGIFYTPQSGIWQTVWMESVVDNYIENIKITPDIDSSSVDIEVFAKDLSTPADIEISFAGKKVASGKTDKDGKAKITFSEYKLWSPEEPNLYDITITLGDDNIKSYFGMRKFGVGNDEAGIPRLMLNNEPYFHNGLLDQGYWSDGLYTAPTDEALIYDIQITKDLGFNMLRKHIKIEPLRWYYHCDRLGMLVWQDFVNGGRGANKLYNGFLSIIGRTADDTNYRWGGRKEEESRKEYYVDSEKTIKLLYNTVSLALWVPFNESWGQFDALKVTDWVRTLDNTRPIDHASGWLDQGGGDFKSTHVYFVPITVPSEKDRKGRCFILSEFGGYSLDIEGHVFNSKKSFGYRKYSSLKEFEAAYHKLFEESIIPLIEKGLSATVYTQITDVEDEINGIITYDRKVVKLDADKLRELNSRVKL
ncbi:MAG TPA: glycoside hydrolase family 2 TIM barrel-domain containing protein [Clostridia bacterium]|jgi:beta-galactosidase/beta-glucuronidase|nr:glycoside hydrolase family 2 TIM barrel-domain containing protein [Clostridia bacterium]